MPLGYACLLKHLNSETKEGKVVRVRVFDRAIKRATADNKDMADLESLGGGTVSGGRMNKRKRNLANELAKGIKEMRKHDAGKLTLRTGKMGTGNIRTKRPGQGLAVTG